MLFSDAVRMLVASAALSHAQGTVNLGTAGSFGALAPAGVSNTGDTEINGDVGTTGTSVTGFPPGLYTGTLAVANEVAKQAQADSTAAFKQGQGLPPTQRFGALASLAGLTLRPGIYSFDSAVTLDGMLTLSGDGLYVIQIGSSLTTGSGSMVNLRDQADPCSVYWIVKSAATIGTTSAFAGNILAGTDITLNTAAEVQGGLYAGSAIVLDSDMINSCGASGGSSNSTVSSSAALPVSSIMPSSTVPANSTSAPASSSSAIVPNNATSTAPTFASSTMRSNATSTAPTFASSTMRSNATSIAPTFASSTMRSNATTSPSTSSASPSRPASISGYFNVSSTVSNPSSFTGTGLPGTGSVPHGISTTAPNATSSAPAHSDCTESTTTTSAYEECEETTTAAAPLPTVTDDCEEAPAIYAVTTFAGAPGYGPPPPGYPPGYPHRY
ncbi:unnamed protein product [Zymoseptoria tritici ST99CH_1A5]|uniref:DUF3494 domain-containing protein n=2 Tax=Zymoseptoria tritici TaxID=1047171 RepID=A0A1Y6LMF2_ZYMTR|nr:unnamed protein product [Zymoseptoria tritici ST99CH_1A5]